MVALRSAIDAGVTDPVVLEAIKQRARSYDVFQGAIHAARTRAALLAGPVPQQQQQADVLQLAVRNARTRAQHNLNHGFNPPAAAAPVPQTMPVLDLNGEKERTVQQ